MKHIDKFSQLCSLDTCRQKVFISLCSRYVASRFTPLVSAYVAIIVCWVRWRDRETRFILESFIFTSQQWVVIKGMTPRPRVRTQRTSGGRIIRKTGGGATLKLFANIWLWLALSGCRWSGLTYTKGMRMMLSCCNDWVFSIVGIMRSWRERLIAFIE